ncbi:MAG: hypothetical protein GY855_07705, partial [candidate division Zixibacteria bacterium]|nr:hypothetical protein [candidate division Zixibacteria bacterium]
YINYELTDSGSVLPSNSVIDIRSVGDTVWIASTRGVGRTDDGGSTWITANTGDGLKSNSISGLAVSPGLVWAATSRSEVIDGQAIPFGTGVTRTTDGGITWQSFTPDQASIAGRLVYDVEITDSTMWAACFYGGLIKTAPGDTIFYNVYPDSASQYDYEEDNFELLRNRFFSVASDTSHTDTTIIYGGSAAGVLKFIFSSSDSVADTVFHYQNADTNATPNLRLPGDFVITMETQYDDGDIIIWAGCKPTGAGEIAISHSTNGGEEWITPDASLGFECWNFAFYENIVYAATTQGLVYSSDYGESWTAFGNFVDSDNHTAYLTNTFYSVEVQGPDTIWAGGPDGVVMTTDGGTTWRVFRSYLPAGSADAGDSYAYPVPFSPMRGTGYARIHYKALSSTSATIKIYDFGMNLVKTVVENKSVLAGQEYDIDTWDGYNGDGEICTNGVYFYRIEMDDGSDWWGKLAILR